MKKFSIVFIIILCLFAGIFFMIDGTETAVPVNNQTENTQATTSTTDTGSNKNGLAMNYSETAATNTENTSITNPNNLAALSNMTANTKTMQEPQKDTYTIKMKTNKGEIVLELNSKIAPNTVKNFVELSNAGFYNGMRFHRVIKGFMIQGGDPLSKDVKMIDRWGTGGPGYRFADEIFDEATYKNGYKRGVVAMANSGPNTNGSQFFIMHADYPLPPSYTIFGKVIKGLETVDSIAAVKVNGNDRPLEDVIVESVTAE